MFDSGESVVHDVDQHAITLDKILHAINTEVDELLIRPSHQHIATVQVTMLKLQSLYTQYRMGGGGGGEEEGEGRRGRGGGGGEEGEGRRGDKEHMQLIII